MRIASALLLCLLVHPVSVAAQDDGPGPVRLSGLFYLTYEQGEEGGTDYAGFFIHRSYFTGRVAILPNLSARITLDGHQDDTGDMKVRLKYAHAKYDFGDLGPVRGLGLEAGIVHMVWLDFEEHVDLYRMRDPMFMERSGLFNSADFGLTLTGSLGPDLGETYVREVDSHYPGRYGSFAVGVYNGGGYHALENNTNKVIEGRLTLRPLPAFLPGFQVSGLAIVGKGNQAGPSSVLPDWRTYDVFLSYQHRRGTLTAQYVWGEGNQKGTFTLPVDPSEATDYSGFSVFGEGRIGDARVIAGYDDLDRTFTLGNESFRRFHAGVGYDLGGQNILLLDLDLRDWDVAGRPTDTRLQAVMQVKF